MESLQNSQVILANSLRWVGICGKVFMSSLMKICCYLFVYFETFSIEAKIPECNLTKQCNQTM